MKKCRIVNSEHNANALSSFTFVSVHVLQVASRCCEAVEGHIQKLGGWHTCIEASNDPRASTVAVHLQTAT